MKVACYSFWTSCTPDARGIVRLSRESQIESEPRHLTAVTRPGPTWLPPPWPHTPSHNYPAIIIPRHAPWLVKVDNSLNKTRNVIHRDFCSCASYPISAELSSLLRVLIAVVDVLILGPAQRRAHCLIRDNYLETIIWRPRLWSYPSYFHLPMTGSDWEDIYWKFIFYGYGVMTSPNQEKLLGQQFSLSSLLFILTWQDNYFSI